MSESDLEEILREQIVYYRARAAEYDEWFYRIGRYDRGQELNRQWFKETTTVQVALHQLGPVESALELACGTGIWTQELAKFATQVVALDASPEMIEINRAKLEAANVEYRVVDLFSWQPEQDSGTDYDLVAFGFWLSHVPPEKLDGFLTNVYYSLRPGGRLFIVDSLPEETSTSKDQTVNQVETGISERRLKDGQTFKIVKIFYDPADLQQKLESLGFEATVSTSGSYFLYAVGTRPAD